MNEAEIGHYSGKRPEWPVVLAALLAGYLALLAFCTAYSADDFWYSTFLDKGVQGYLELAKEHYQTFNGRILVHLFAQIILHFGTWLFALIMFASVWAMPRLATGRTASAEQVNLAALVFLMGMTLLPRSMVVEGLTWISAFCNYVLPTVLLLIQLLLLTRFVRKGGRALGLICCIISLLCGATTEQSGLVSVYVAFYAVCLCLRGSKKRLGVCLFGMACSALGLATIFASPATRLRMTAEGVSGGSMGLGPKLTLGLDRQAEAFFDGFFLPVTLLMLFALGALLLWTGHKRTPAKLGTGIAVIGAACLLAGSAFPEKAGLCYALAQLCLFAFGIPLWLSGRGRLCALLHCGLVSLAVLLTTDSIAPRTMLPYALFLLLSLAWIAGELLQSWNRARYWLLPVFVLAAVLAVNQFPGYWYNYQIECLNRDYVKQAQDTGVLYYCMDYDREYTHTKAYEDGLFYSTYAEAAGIDPDTASVYFYSDNLPKVYANGQRLTSPALPSGQNDGWLLPLRGIVEAFGGTVEFLDGVGAGISFPNQAGEQHYIWNGSELVWTDADGTENHEPAEQAAHYYAICLSQRVYTDIFGLNIQFREDGDTGGVWITGNN